MSKPNERECQLVDNWYAHYEDKTDSGWAKLALANTIAAYREEIESRLTPRPETGGDGYEVGTPRQFAERLAWMTINGKPDLDQWENHIKHRDAALLASQGQGNPGNISSCGGCTYINDASGGSCDTCSRSWIGVGSDHYNAHPQPDGLREALEWYANAKHYRQEPNTFSNPGGKPFIPALADYGGLARAALAQADQEARG